MARVSGVKDKHVCYPIRVSISTLNGEYETAIVRSHILVFAGVLGYGGYAVAQLSVGFVFENARLAFWERKPVRHRHCSKRTGWPNHAAFAENFAGSVEYNKG